MTPLEHYQRAETLAWAALGPVDPDGVVLVELGDHVAFVSPTDAIALAGVHAQLAAIPRATTPKPFPHPLPKHGGTT